MVGTSRGDGTVTWESGRIGGIGRFFYMPVAHGDLTASPEHFAALVDLLTTGATAQLPSMPPAVRAIEQAVPVSYDAGPPSADDPDALQRLLLGGALRNRVPPRPKRRLEVAVKAMDLRFLSEPLMVGHYEQDPIAGPQALVDRELLAGDLSERHSLGLYAGPRGTAVVVLRVPAEQERLSGRLSGAVVTGLGAYDGALSLSNLTESVRAGALRYLLQIIDVLGKADREVPLATLLIGYNSSANLTIPASVEALVRGVTEANARFFETTRLNIRIARLDIVELYLDTAITAAYALRQLAPRLEAHAERQGTRLVCRGELVRGEGVRQRLLDRSASAYWPRLIVTDADAGTRAPGGVGGASTVIADRLRFLYVGQRARAESVMQQRQPGLIEALVRQQIQHAVWQEDFGRMLFQLMTPPDFKDAARQLDRLVLVVDAATANLPWELMLADDPTRRDGDKRPLALRMAVVRQLASSTFRRQVRQAIARSALVIGNPSVQGFEKAFTDAQGRALTTPPALPGAQSEAEGVAALLGSMGYRHVEQAIGDGANAASVLGKLYQQPWRVLHISAHGVYGLPHVDGQVRSGVLLSDGLLITAAEISAMEVVPELVFLNCCHLGQVDAGDGWQREGNKLAASVARELIEIGVRCVVVAGWAVNDAGAQRFGQVFYEQLLLARRSFGDAVFAAREAVWEADPQDITWGAFQAYGDPGWLAEPRGDGRSAGTQARYVSPEELLDDLARLRADLSRKRDHLSARELRAQGDAVEAILSQRCPPGWRRLPSLQSALGATWRDLCELERAREAFLLAIQAEDQLGQVPIDDIEQLARIEARFGEQLAEAAIAKGEDLAAADAWIDLALQRLDGLDALVSAQVQTAPDAVPAWVPNSPRSAARGGAWKRKASLQARALLRAAAPPRPDPAAIDRARAAMDAALVRSIEAYRIAEGQPGSAHFSPALALNRLALDALTPWPEPAARDAAIALARECAARADSGPDSPSTVWDRLMRPQALLAERLLDGSLGRDDDTGQALFDSLVQAFADALAHVTIKPQQIDSMASHQELLSRFFDAHSVSQHGDVASRLTGTRLLALAQRLQPGRPARSDRPGAPLAPRSSAATRRKAATPSGSGASAQAKPKGSAKAPGNAAHKASPVPRSPRKKPSRPRD
jgi:CHAT domain-containing protein